MRIENLKLKNFKGFKECEFPFHPEFNLVIGVNGTGKTSLLDALSVALGSWFLGIRGYGARHIGPQEVRLADFRKTTDADEIRHQLDTYWEAQFPCLVEAKGTVFDQDLMWERSLNAPGGHTNFGRAGSIKKLAAETDAAVRHGDNITLPLISHYTTGRLWNMPRKQARVDDGRAVANKKQSSRLTGYEKCLDPRLSVAAFTRWFARQSWISFQHNSNDAPEYTAVVEAIKGCLSGAKRIYFDAAYGEIIVDFESSGIQPFNNLSDGQRCMLAMVGDIAQRAATLNPHLGGRVLEETPGVVLIDELDLHLHPKWQLRVIENLRRAFPKIQFICTTHSPFLIQSLRSGEELLALDGQPTAQLADMPIGTIAEGIMGVPTTQVSQRYLEMKSVARKYFETLEEAKTAPKDKLENYKLRLAEAIEPYADNPAFQAFLEMKRVAKLGE